MIKYNCPDLIESITDPLGGIRAFEYDANGNLLKETNPDGYCTTYTYNALNQPVKITDALGFCTNITYTSTNRISSVTDKNGNITRYNYDAAGNIIETVDANGHSSYFEYDTLNRLVKMRLYRVEDGADVTPDKQITLYQYNSQGLVTKVINSQGSEKLFIYDENGNLLQKNDEDGYITTYQYSPTNLVKSINYSDEKKVCFEYNKAGKLVEVKDWLGATSFELDALNRITAVNDHRGKRVSYGYDPAGNKTSITYPDETTAAYVYDPLKRLSSITDNSGQKTLYNYSPAGALIQMSRPNGIAEHYECDSLGRRVSAAYSTPDSKAPQLANRYNYDAQGNIIEEFNGHLLGDSADETVLYAYDALNRLTTVTRPHENLSRSYEYDSLGNLLQETEISESNTSSMIKYQIDELNRLVGKKTVHGEGQSVFGYAYDKRGNLVQEINETSGTEATYAYDVTGRMVKGVNHAGQDSSYIFNGLGARVGTSTEGGNNTTEYVMDYMSSVPKELLECNKNATDEIVQRYVYAGRHKIAADVSLSTNGPIATDTLASTLQYHTDRLGSITHITDSNGNVQAKASYDEWGNRYKHFTSSQNSKSKVLIELIQNYTGHSYDHVLGQYYSKARMYDASNKRFMSEDLVKGYARVPSTLIAYNYCMGNPLRYVDLDGRVAVDLSGVSLATDEEGFRPTVEPRPTPPPAPVPPPEPEPDDDDENDVDPSAYNIYPLRVIFHAEHNPNPSNNYRGVSVNTVHRWVPNFFFASNAAMGWRNIYIGSGITNRNQNVSNLIRHEYGHHIQWQLLGGTFIDFIGWRSYRSFSSGAPFVTSTDPNSYELQIWEVTASMFGGVPRRDCVVRDIIAGRYTRTLEAEIAGLRYIFFALDIINRSGNERNLALADFRGLSNEALINRVNDFPLPGTGSINHARDNLARR